ncbi:lysoplasmalogenase [Microbacterium ulmi]|uniref:lysoplasmalogenase n=1 Tax=Microbacterium ulmi TaxID=179095 RepID=UPI003132CFE6|nr:putative membrane protein YhhN [Microbacterium ulmi]
MHATSAPARDSDTVPALARSWWWGLALYAVVSAVHIGALAAGAADVSGPTKLALMPALALAVVWAARGARWRPAHTLLVAAIVLSWLGDGAHTFFPFLDDELPAMLLCFGLAHIAYIVLFQRHLAVRRMPWWALVYAAWWIALIAILWPHLGGLAIAVAVYGLVLGGTAASSTRCHPLVVWGGALFLASDSILAFLIFTPDAMPVWADPLVMLTYCAGQGLIATGAVIALRRAAR